MGMAGQIRTSGWNDILWLRDEITSVEIERFQLMLFRLGTILIAIFVELSLKTIPRATTFNWNYCVNKFY